MKLLSLFILIFAFFNSFSQQEEFHFEGRIIDSNQKPIADVYIINYRDLDKNVSRENGIFDIWVLPGDSLIISHISYYRKIVTVHSLLINPIIQLELDTINILEIDVYNEPKGDLENAMNNIDAIEFSFKPLPTDDYTESERSQILMNSENRVHRSAASSVSILSFSPSEQIGKIIKRIKRRKKSNKYSSTRKKK